MRNCDIEAKGIVYDEKGRLILNKKDKITIYDAKGRLIQLEDEVIFMRVPIKVFNIWKGKTYQENNEFDTYFTNERVVGLCRPNPRKMEMLEYGAGIVPAISHYTNELNAYLNNALICQEFYWHEVEKTEVYRKSFETYLKEDGTRIEMYLKDCVSINMLLKFFDAYKIPYTVIPFLQTTNRLIFNRLKHGDIEGLNLIYDLKGNPILENDENILNKVITSGSLEWFEKDYWIIPEFNGILYKTNKRLLFIRKATPLYFNKCPSLPKETHIYFYFNPQQADKIFVKNDKLIFEFNCKLGRLKIRKARVHAIFPINEVRGILREYL